MEIFNCRKCNKEYESYSNLDKKSKILNKYVRYLGFCKEKCFNKLDKGEQEKDLMTAYIYGDIKKRRHSVLTHFKV